MNFDCLQNVHFNESATQFKLSKLRRNCSLSCPQVDVAYLLYSDSVMDERYAFF